MSQNGKKTIEELKQDSQGKVLDRDAMNQVKGGKVKRSWIQRLYSGFTPQ